MHKKNKEIKKQGNRKKIKKGLEGQGNFQGESNMHHIVVNVLCRLCPLFPKGNLPFSGAGKRPVSVGSHTISTASPV